MQGTLADLRTQFASVMDDLARMGKHMVGTDWHTDRVEEARWLTRTIDRMEGRDPLAN